MKIFEDEDEDKDRGDWAHLGLIFSGCITVLGRVRNGPTNRRINGRQGRKYNLLECSKGIPSSS